MGKAGPLEIVESTRAVRVILVPYWTLVESAESVVVVP